MTLPAELFRVAFVTHGGGGIGGGHVSRSLALAQGFIHLGVSIGLVGNSWAVETFSGRLRDSDSRLVAVHEPFEDGLPDVLMALKAMSPGAVVVDSYRAGPGVLDILGEIAPVAVIDDMRPFPVEEHCGSVINYSFSAMSIGYSRCGACDLKLGPGYALLREEFWSLHGLGGSRCLVIPGASDVLGVLPTLIRWWISLDLPPADFVVGPMVDHLTLGQAEEIARGASNVRVLRAPADLPLRMASSSMVMCTSSVTAYEALGLCKPLVVFQVADNQLSTGEAIGRMAAGINLGMWGTWGPSELSRAMGDLKPPPKGLVNPMGAMRAARELLELWNASMGHGI